MEGCFVCTKVVCPALATYTFFRRSHQSAFPSGGILFSTLLLSDRFDEPVLPLNLDLLPYSSGLIINSPDRVANPACWE